MQTANVTELCDVESPFYVETKRAHGYVTSSHAAHYDIHLSVNNVRSESCVLSIVRVRRSSIIRSSFGIVPGNDRVPPSQDSCRVLILVESTFRWFGACRSKRVDSAVLTDLSFFSRESFERSIDTRRAWASQFAEVADNITFHVCDLVSKRCGVNNIVYDIVFQLSLDGLGEKVGGAVITGLSDSDIG